MFLLHNFQVLRAYEPRPYSREIVSMLTISTSAGPCPPLLGRFAGGSAVQLAESAAEVELERFCCGASIEGDARQLVAFADRIEERAQEFLELLRLADGFFQP